VAVGDGGAEGGSVGEAIALADGEGERAAGNAELDGTGTGVRAGSAVHAGPAAVAQPLTINAKSTAAGRTRRSNGRGFTAAWSSLPERYTPAADREEAT
jgi:hypothetical protein